ncbi:MAG: biopolymer transporter ExbD [Proteobacteria bacterium]|nr:biopolymer transporter ExbD [Pseudomonadota bacterium]MCP4920856.1 biopolymer transporter ExbD [Pseudomonadota bacterium]
MGAKVGGSKGGANSDINVTPLIDVVLVLLIIFMVLTPRTIEEITASLPSKTETKKKQDDKNDQLLVAVYEDGSAALNLKKMDDRELWDQLRKRLRAKEKKVVFVDAHPNLEFGRVVSMMDLAKDAGADRVGLARIKDEGPKAPEGDAAAVPPAPEE